MDSNWTVLQTFLQYISCLRPCYTGNYDELVIKNIIKKSMEEVGCIVPFLPSSISHQYPVCESNITGSAAFNIYETLIEKQTYSKEEKGSFLFLLRSL